MELQGHRIAVQGAASLGDNAPKASGTLSRSFRHQVTKTDRTVRVFWTVDPSMEARLGFVTRGTPAHAIHARGKALKLQSGAFRRSVRHPGTAPNDFVQRTLTQLDARSYWARAAEDFSEGAARD